MTDREFLEREIAKWKSSPQRIMQIKGSLYYDNEHDILKRKRTMIGDDGKLQVVENLPNNRIIDNQYAKMVNQKANYLFGQPFAIECKNDRYAELLKKVFNKKFMKTLKNSGKAAYNGGICWLYPYYTESGEFSFRLFPGYEVLPFWKDNEHTILDFAIRLYLVIGYEGTVPTVIQKVEVYDLDGVHKFILDRGTLIPDLANDGESDCYHVTMTDAQGNVQGFNWSRIPLIPLKANELETPLLKKVKSLQDGINVMLSDFENNMQEDARNTILVLKNYDGTNLGEFRKNLATYGAVKVRYDGDTKGGVETLEITVNADNYKAIIEIFKKALIENAMGYDAKDDRLSGNPNQMNIQSMYSDIDIDANDTETEYQAAFEEILWFVNAHLANTGQGNFEGEEVNIIFNRDILMNESEVIDNCQKSVGILSDETIIGQHPWVDDPAAEIERLEKQKQKEQEDMLSQYNPFGQQNQTDPNQGNQGGGVDEE
jgi:SPP1 family phage portal protein